MKYAAISLALGAFFYLCAAFINMDFDPSEWDAHARGTLVFFWIISSLCITVLVYEEDKEGSDDE